MSKKIIKKIDKQDFSQPYNCIHSVQKLNSIFDTNVFAANIPLKQLFKNRDILLVDDLKGDARWGMNKIIQRNISDKRVEEIKNEYLQASNRSIKFFPAITIVLLPKTKGEPRQSFENTKYGFDNIKGVEIEKGYESDEFEYDMPVELKWDKNQISALVIDGQHRVSAIRKFYDGKNESSFDNISIPATFVLFKNNNAIDLIQATRSLFIDVNNTPRLVSEERLIFIDDRNIQRRISAKIFGSNAPGEETEDVYQIMLQSEDFLLADDSFVNRYLIEESGKDDEEARGFLSNHSTLFPWEISNVMSIHKNILGNILLRYKEVDKTRDIRSICFQLHRALLEEIENYNSIEQLSDDNTSKIVERLKTSGLSESEIEIFTNLIAIKKRNLEEVQQAEGEFLVGTSADANEEREREEFIEILKNVYNQDCTKDSAFELSSSKVTELFEGKTSHFISIIVKTFNSLWFTKKIKESILSYNGDERELIFNFIVYTHETLKIHGTTRRKSDKVGKQIKEFARENEISAEKTKVLRDWNEKIEESQAENLLRTLVGQEMLFTYILSENEKINDIQLDDVIDFINTLGKVGLFNSVKVLKVNFFNIPDFTIENFNPWSEILMKGDTMKPGIVNANKGADFLYLLRNKMTDRTNAQSQIRKLERIQKSYALEILNKLERDDSQKRLKMYLALQKFPDKQLYLSPSEISAIEEKFDSGDLLTPKHRNIIGKAFGAIALTQVIDYYNQLIEN
ncbi:DNA-sulfur modification-associated [Parapedobacter luteus]|uniref:DNA-sulfur modification-associated n=1 Tax=Parapedobacter luteus TaxID=623280 RepID=A0A1T5CTE0_9SPHI|nr:DNA sulfur modification protein DndB [Parapedobacter luteus]SKB62684.1 DNA-sulfur modification-associated [Parapedobacter luteus]